MFKKSDGNALLKLAVALLLQLSFYTPASSSTTTINHDTLTVDSTQLALKKIAGQLDFLKRTSISGYLQAQFQYADSSGIESFEGGNFAPNVDKRFQIRRARFRITHEERLGIFTIQIDGNERGVKVMDFYGRLTDPWIKTFSITAGAFSRPFGFEVNNPSNLRESTERGRMSQTLFPSERDIGAMLSVQFPTKYKLHFIKWDAGFFNGVGRLQTDFDKQKDFISRLYLIKANKSKTIQYGGGVSYYRGGSRMNTNKYYNRINTVNNVIQFSADSSFSNAGSIAAKEYKGADAQFSFHWLLGQTTLRAEYIKGYTPSTKSSTLNMDVQPTTDIYKRHIDGAYFYFIQTIGKTKLQTVVKYDWFDPNTKIKGNQIGAKGNTGKANNFTSADIKYSTLGLGIIYNWDDNVRLTAYYAMVQNEKTQLTGFTQDIPDNVFTFRVMYKF
ncbi:MAG: porin [Bacteroidetes bacterium]|nr:porin [Bacteroidota bacterium]